MKRKQHSVENAEVKCQKTGHNSSEDGSGKNGEQQQEKVNATTCDAPEAEPVLDVSSQRRSLLLTEYEDDDDDEQT